MKLAVGRDEGVDLAVVIAEVADQHIIAEPAETGRCDGDPPGGGEAAAGDQFPNEVAVFIKDRHRACPNLATSTWGRLAACRSVSFIAMSD